MTFDKARALVFFAVALGACGSQQEYKEAPDAAPPPCKTAPAIFCQPVTDGSPACSTDDGTSTLLQRLPRGTRYAVGCTVNYVGERDQQGDCALDAVCKCVTSQDVEAGSKAPRWNCFP